MPRKDDRIGPYTLIEKLGRGSFGVVWLAENRTALAITKVALKLPNDEDIDLEAIKQEASLWVAASGHPNVLPIIEANIYDEQVVIVSEYAPDGSLAQWLKNNGGKAPTIKEAVEITAGILSGLEHLHTRKIIHRDLKPANILLQGQTPRLVDFGLSRVMKSTSHSRAVSGTYQYMPPESFKGERSPQTDIWSAGVILYETLCGNLPFPQQDDPSLLYAILNDPPSALPSYLSDELKEIVAKALQKNLKQRYQTVAAMRSDLITVLQTATHSKPELQEPETKVFPKANEQQTLVLPQEPLKTSPSPTIQSSPQKQADTIKDSPEIRQQNITPQLSKPPKKISRRALLFGFGAFASVLLIGFIGLSALLINSSTSNMTTANKSQPMADKEQSSNSNQSMPTSQTDSLPKKLTNKIGMKFVLIPAGSFMMGSEYGNEKPKHRVTISKPFYMGQYEVTQAQWQVIMGTSIRQQRDKEDKSYGIYGEGDNYPMYYISWEDTQEFIKKLNTMGDGMYRLPTEAEWEYACRAGTTGDYAGNLNEMAWYGSNTAVGKSHPVGTKKPNTWELYDMHGNVDEWVQDWYGNYSSESVTDPTGAADGSDRVNRGGNWAVNDLGLRSASRNFNSPSNRDIICGFRLVRIPS